MSALFRSVLVSVIVFVSSALSLAGERPNVLFIAVDDLNDWIGCLGGHPDEQSPDIDARCVRTVDFVDLYPTLSELCGLPVGDHLGGESLVPLLKDPNRSWSFPAITTHGRNNHAVRTQRWRYIRYADGGEELYDHEEDPMEWSNLAKSPFHQDIKDGLAKWLPEQKVPEAPYDKKSRKKQAISLRLTRA